MMYSTGITLLLILAGTTLAMGAGGVALPRDKKAVTEPEPTDTPTLSTEQCPPPQVQNIYFQAGDATTGGRGEKGDNGPPGEMGPQGQQGVRGLPGAAGQDGTDGVKGDTGMKGAHGSDGRDGIAGTTGLQGPPGPPGPTAGGATYIRWGRTTCNSTAGTELLYSGRAAGSYYSNPGGGANYLCLPDDPEFLRYTNGVQSSNRAYLYGAEYEAFTSPPAFGSMANHNVPCAVCYTPTRGTMIMIPAKITCPPSWTREYYGYLMSEASIYSNRYRTMFECVDNYAESVPGSAADTNGAMFLFTESRCNGIACPPYAEGKELACTVCTK